MGRVTKRVRVQRVEGDARTEVADVVAVEEPLEIRWAGRALAVTMRTPGHDLELLHGWLFSEGLIATREDVLAARYCAGATDIDEDGGGNTYNVLDVTPRPGVPGPERARAFVTSSACGVCGADSIEALRTEGRFDPRNDPLAVGATTLSGLPDRLRSAQKTFDTTGGVHAAGLFTPEGEPLVVREDVGRHNAVDKVIGWAILAGRLPLRGLVLQVSGRASFELVQKAYLAGLPLLSAVSAPSSLAVDTARATGVTLAGFVRAGRFVLYSEPQRVVG